jgi:DNA replication protein DnaC
MVFCGEVGTGKTFTAVCIANRLLSQGYTVQVSNFADIVGKIQQDFSERNSYLKKLTDLDLLIIDDLSAERNSEYMNEQIFSVIDARYKAKQPMIFTTNLRADEIKEPVETIKKRIYSRIIERCRIVEFEGANRRKNNGRLNLQKYDGIFNF